MSAVTLDKQVRLYTPRVLGGSVGSFLKSVGSKIAEYAPKVISAVPQILSAIKMIRGGAAGGNYSPNVIGGCPDSVSGSGSVKPKGPRKGSGIDDLQKSRII